MLASGVKADQLPLLALVQDVIANGPDGTGRISLPDFVRQLVGSRDLRDGLADLVADLPVIAGSGISEYAESLADLNAILADDGTFGAVVSVSDDRGIYKRVAGAWDRVAPLPAILADEVDFAIQEALAARDTILAALTVSDGLAIGKSAIPITYVGDGLNRDFPVGFELGIKKQIEAVRIGGVDGLMADLHPDDYAISPDDPSDVRLAEAPPDGSRIVIVVSVLADAVPGEAADLLATGFGDAQAALDARGPQFATRADLVAWWVLYRLTQPSGTVLTAAGHRYVADASAPGLPGLPGLVPDEAERPEHHGAVGDGQVDDTDALISFLSSRAGVGHADWGTGGRYKVTQPLSGFSGVLNAGHARIERLAADGTTATTHIGPDWSEVPNVLYVSPVGGGDGLSKDSPLDLTSGYQLLEERAGLAPNVQWTLEFLPGTYPDGASRRLETLPSTRERIVFKGPDVSGGVPTAIFQNWTSATFRRLSGSGTIKIEFRDIKSVGGTAGFIEIRFGTDAVVYNVHAADASGFPPVFLRESRQCVVELCDVQGSSSADLSSGITLQGCYGTVRGCKVDGVTSANGLGTAVDVSRGSSMYVQNSEFGLRAANDIHVNGSRQFRARVRGNQFGPANTAPEVYTGPGVRNEDPGELNTLTSLSFGSPAIICGDGVVDSRVVGQLGQKQAHLRYTGAPVSFSGTARQENGLLSPFRMPATWLFSPTARGFFEMEVLIPVAETVTFEISGEASGAGQRVAYQTITTTGFTRARWKVDFTGPLGSGTQGQFMAEWLDESGTSRNFNATAGLNQPQLSGATEADMRFRLYVTRSVGTGGLDVLHTASFVVL